MRGRVIEGYEVHWECVAGPVGVYLGGTFGGM